MFYYRQLFHGKRYRNLIDEMSNKLINGNKVEEDLLMYYGFVMLEIGMPQKCIACLNNLLKETYKLERIRYYKYMGLAHYMLGDYKKSYKFFSKLEYVKEIEDWINLLDLKRNNMFVETENMNFYFTNGISDGQIISFINKNKKAYQHIQSTFNCVLPKKIDIYVFNTECDNLGNVLSYANPSLCTIHTKLEHTYGHELAHVIYWYLYPSIIKTRFIDEGIATYFDRENYFKVYDINSFDFGQYRRINITDMWLNFEKYDNVFSYNIAGFFISFLIENYSMDLLKKFLKEQTLEHAEIVFGVSFKSKLKSFEQMINNSLQGRHRSERKE